MGPMFEHFEIFAIFAWGKNGTTVRGYIILN